MAALMMVCLISGSLFAGNPDRQGEAGAYELLMNPWARSAGIHGMSTSFASGVEAMRINVAGVGRINKTEIVASNAQYFAGSGLTLNAAGLAQRMGESGALGISLMSLDFGDIPVTTVNNPEGTGATFSPSFFNLGVSYTHTFENKISVGVLVRGVSESIADVNAFAAAMDAGVQYVSGERDQFKFGISLRNIGNKMKFSGEGLADVATNNEDQQYRFDVQAAGYELPSLLNIGLSYDFYVQEINRLTAFGNFTANSFSRDNVGGGVEYGFKEMFMVRVGYLQSVGETVEDEAGIYTGLAAGVTIDVPVSKNSNTRRGIDYGYRATAPYDGTHNFGLRISL
jgi:hypothetical protein